MGHSQPTWSLAVDDSDTLAIAAMMDSNLAPGRSMGLPAALDREWLLSAQDSSN